MSTEDQWITMMLKKPRLDQLKNRFQMVLKEQQSKFRQQCVLERQFLNENASDLKEEILNVLHHFVSDETSIPDGEKLDMYQLLKIGLYDDLMKQEQEVIRSLKDHDGKESQEDICPFCKKDVLLQNNRVIFCACGIRIDTRTDIINMETFKSSIRDAEISHQKQCDDEPYFVIEGYDEYQFVMIKCKKCSILEIVI